MSETSGSDGFVVRRAPYAPISALSRFFEKIRDRTVPERVDHRFLEKLNVASNNEYSLLSALKFLGVIDDRGVPTHAYRLLQTSDRFEDTLWHLTTTAYRPVFEAGADGWPEEDLINYFRVSSSPSQARNAARFFRAVCALAGGGRQGKDFRGSGPTPDESTRADTRVDHAGGEALPRRVAAAVPDASSDLLLQTKAQLLEKLPAADPRWSATEYEAICARFLDMLRNLDSTG